MKTGKMLVWNHFIYFRIHGIGYCVKCGQWTREIEGCPFWGCDWEAPSGNPCLSIVTNLEDGDYLSESITKMLRDGRTIIDIWRSLKKPSPYISGIKVAQEGTCTRRSI